MIGNKKLLVISLVGTIVIFLLSLLLEGPDVSMFKECQVLQQEHRSLVRRNRKLHEDIQSLEAKVTEIREQMTVKRDLQYEDLPSVNQVESCEVVHVVMVVAGFGTCRDVYPMIKSILFYRTHPLHFYFLSDKNAAVILRNLFHTWDLPRVDVSILEIEMYKPLVEWVPNIHYSGVFGLMKLVLPEILPLDVEQVIVLDTDLTFAADITELWTFFSEMKEKGKILGIIENQSDWYLGRLWTNHKPWPAVGRGFNTGVMLQDLKEMRNMKWNEIWKKVAQETLPEFGSTSLADQDVVNAVLKKYDPELHLLLPCVWNIQLGDHSLSEGCYEDSADLKVLHWNSPLKLQVLHKHAHIFKNQYLTFQEYNGELLRKDLVKCPSCPECRNKAHDETLVDDCILMKQFAKEEYRTHLYFVDFNYQSSSSSDITLVSQLSFDRLHLLESLAKHWHGPMSLTVYLSDAETVKLLELVQTSPVLSTRMNLGLHVVYKKGPFYPVNYLRNVALSHTVTPFVFLSDVDFLPNYNSYKIIMTSIASTVSEGGLKALVVPAFETLQYKFAFPTSKKDLLKRVKERKVIPFRSQEWPRGHKPTDYETWFTSNATYKDSQKIKIKKKTKTPRIIDEGLNSQKRLSDPVEKKMKEREKKEEKTPVDWSPDFEPYVVVRNSVHLYDTRFLGFGWNKVSHIMTMDAYQYKFIVLPDVFMIHLPHAPSTDILKYRAREVYRKCMNELKREFINQLSDSFNTNKYL